MNFRLALLDLVRKGIATGLRLQYELAGYIDNVARKITYADVRDEVMAAARALFVQSIARLA